MSNVTNIRHAIPVSQELSKALFEFEAALNGAISSAKEAGLPQGLLVAMLHAASHIQTAKMVE